MTPENLVFQWSTLKYCNTSKTIQMVIEGWNKDPTPIELSIEQLPYPYEANSHIKRDNAELYEILVKYVNQIIACDDVVLLQHQDSDLISFQPCGCLVSREILQNFFIEEILEIELCRDRSEGMRSGRDRTLTIDELRKELEEMDKESESSNSKG